MQGYKVYLTGESYAGQYIPYLAAGFLDQNDTTHFNLKGIQINDPSINEDGVMIYGKSYYFHPPTSKYLKENLFSSCCSGIEPFLECLRS